MLGAAVFNFGSKIVSRAKFNLAGNLLLAEFGRGPALQQEQFQAQLEVVHRVILQLGVIW